MLTFSLAIVAGAYLSDGTGNEKVQVLRVEWSVEKMLFCNSHTLLIHVLSLLVSAIEQKVLLSVLAVMLEYYLESHEPWGNIRKASRPWHQA